MKPRWVSIIVFFLIVGTFGYFLMGAFSYDYDNKIEMCDWCESKGGICNSFSLQVSPKCRIKIDNETYKEYSIFNCAEHQENLENNYCFLMPSEVYK